MEKFFSFKNILIIILLAVVVWQYRTRTSFGDEIIIEGEPYEIVRVERDTVYQNVIQRVNIYSPPLVYTLYDTTFVELTSQDSSRVVRDFFASNITIDTLRLVLNDSTEFGSIVLTDVVRENRIQSRQWEGTYDIPEIRETVVVRRVNPIISNHIGGVVTSVGQVGVLYNHTRHNLTYGVGLLTSQDGPSVTASVLIKIF